MMATGPEQLGLLEAPDAELPELAGSSPTPQSSPRRRLAAVGAAAAVIGLAALALVGSLALGKEPVQGLAKKPPKTLVLMQDFRQLGDDLFTPWDSGASLDHNVEHAFSHFLSASGLGDELTDRERSVYEQNMVAEMDRLSKGHPVSEHEWQERLKEAAEDEKPEVTESFINHVNGQNLGFELELRDWMTGITQKDVRQHLGLTEPSGPPPQAPRPKPMSGQLPEDFNTHKKWSMCANVIRRDHNQGTCGSCWAFAALSVLDSRLCIKTGGDFKGVRGHLSRTYATSCARKDDKGNHIDGCKGGWSHEVFNLAASHGIPTGGSQGCLPYFASGEGTDHFDTKDVAPPCPGQCARPQYPRSLHSDKFVFGTVTEGWYYSEDKGERTTSSRVHQVMQSLMEDGPVVAYVYVGQEFFAYKSGILNVGCNEDSGNHAVTALGFGGNNCPHGYGNCNSFYWTLLNSWGDHWGDGGEMKIAACVATSFDIPGKISDSDVQNLPSPLFPTGGDRPAPTKKFEVKTGPCTVDSSQCITSPHWPGHYHDSEECSIQVLDSGVKLQVEEFSTESGYDILTVNGKQYSGDTGPHLVTASGTISWTADESATQKGWKLCPAQETAETAPHESVDCETIFDDLQLREGEEKTVSCPSHGCVGHGDVWGTNPYTTDSALCSAASHAGKKGGPVTVKAVGPRPSYQGSLRNGVHTGNSDPWDGAQLS